MSPKQRLATNGHTRTWSAASLGVAHCGVDLVNDTDTTMVVDSVMAVPNGGNPLRERREAARSEKVSVRNGVVYGTNRVRMRIHHRHSTDLFVCLCVEASDASVRVRKRGRAR